MVVLIFISPERLQDNPIEKINSATVITLQRDMGRNITGQVM